jgi:hypothetical protein
MTQQDKHSPAIEGYYKLGEQSYPNYLVADILVVVDWLVLEGGVVLPIVEPTPKVLPVRGPDYNPYVVVDGWENELIVFPEPIGVTLGDLEIFVGQPTKDHEYDEYIAEVAVLANSGMPFDTDTVIKLIKDLSDPLPDCIDIEVTPSPKVDGIEESVRTDVWVVRRIIEDDEEDEDGNELEKQDLGQIMQQFLAAARHIQSIVQ